MPHLYPAEFKSTKLVLNFNVSTVSFHFQVILQDVIKFLVVYIVFLLGFGVGKYYWGKALMLCVSQVLALL